MSVMTDASRTTPRRVLRRAFELGVHADCVAADYEGSCESCISIFNDVFHEFYGHAENAAEAMQMIIDDIRRDHNDG